MDIAHYQHAYLTALQAGDEPAAQATVDHARHAGVQADQIYYAILAPSMVRIGELWERNELSVAEEHLATAITERMIGRLSPEFTPLQGQACGLVVVGCVSGERHLLGLRMLSDMLRVRGWRVLDLGADVPTADWVRLSLRYHADAVAISVNNERHLDAAAELISALHAAASGLTVLAGGAALDRNPQAWRAIGADLYDADPARAVGRLTEKLGVRG